MYSNSGPKLRPGPLSPVPDPDPAAVQHFQKSLAPESDAPSASFCKHSGALVEGLCHGILYRFIMTVPVLTLFLMTWRTVASLH
jgi:hypothetical protein